MAFKVFVLVLLVFALGNFAFVIFAPSKYNSSLRKLRKGLYTLFVSAISFGLLTDEIKLSNWQFLLTLTTIVVFVDLALLLTPSIMKIWKAEFQYTDFVENIITDNYKIHLGTSQRAGTMSRMIQEAGEYFEGLEPIVDDWDKKKQMESYLKSYADEFGFAIQLWDIDSHPAESELVEGEAERYIESISKGIMLALMRIELLNTLEFGKKRNSYLKTLLESSILSELDEGGSMIVPILMEDFQMLVFLKRTSGEVLEVDAVHITNLIYLYLYFTRLWYN